MQVNDLSPYLENAVAEVLEAMCFISSEGVATLEAEESKTDWICGELDFQGDTSGTFGIAVPPAIAMTIAANFLGEDETVLTTKETNEVICELTNMVCGTLLAQLDSRTMFTLSPPRSRSVSPRLAGSDSIYHTYAIDEGYIDAWVEMRMTV